MRWLIRICCSRTWLMKATVLYVASTVNLRSELKVDSWCAQPTQTDRQGQLRPSRSPAQLVMSPDEEEGYQVNSWRKYFRVHFTIGLGTAYELALANKMWNFARSRNPINYPLKVRFICAPSFAVSVGYFCNGNLMVWLSKLFFYDCQVSKAI